MQRKFSSELESILRSGAARPRIPISSLNPVRACPFSIRQLAEGLCDDIGMLKMMNTATENAHMFAIASRAAFSFIARTKFFSIPSLTIFYPLLFAGH